MASAAFPGSQTGATAGTGSALVPALANGTIIGAFVLFDRHRKIAEDMGANLDKATPEQKADLVRLLVEQVTARDRKVSPDDIVWTPPVMPFFVDVVERPRTDSNRRRRP